MQVVNIGYLARSRCHLRHIRAKSPMAKDRGQRHYWNYLVEKGFNDVHDEDEIFSFAHDFAVLYVDEEAS